MSEMCLDLIDYLIELRKARGITQRQLAKETHLTQSAIARFESKRTVPQLDTLYRIVSALNCRIHIIPNYKSTAK